MHSNIELMTVCAKGYRRRHGEDLYHITSLEQLETASEASVDDLLSDQGGKNLYGPWSEIRALAQICVRAN